MAALTSILGALNTASAVGGTAYSIFGNSTRKQKQQEQRQLELQKQLTEHNAEVNYGYNEMSAEEAYRRQQEQWQRENEYNLPINQRKRIQEAGLNPALLYEGSAGVGQGGSAGGGIAGGGAGGPAGGKAANAAEQEMARLQRKEYGLQLAKLGSEIELTKAEAKRANKEADNLEGDTERERESRDLFIENLRLIGEEKFIENIKNKFKVEYGDENLKGIDGIISENNKTGTTIRINKESYFTEEEAIKIAKAWAETNESKENRILTMSLTRESNNRVAGYWEELLNATAHAEAAKTEAAAKKLEIEIKRDLLEIQREEHKLNEKKFGFESGEDITWKSLEGIAKTVILTLSGAFRGK